MVAPAAPIAGAAVKKFGGMAARYAASKGISKIGSSAFVQKSMNVAGKGMDRAADAAYNIGSLLMGKKPEEQPQAPKKKVENKNTGPKTPAPGRPGGMG